MMRATKLVVLLCVVVLSTPPGQSRRLSAADPAVPATAPTFNYSHLGGDWPGTCKTGREQTPINVVPSVSVPIQPNLVIDMGNLTFENITIKHNLEQYYIQVDWKNATGQPLTVPVMGDDFFTAINYTNATLAGTVVKEAAANLTRLALDPIQLHWHTPSEHTINGELFPLELHIIFAAPPGSLPGCPQRLSCLAVFAVMYRYGATEDIPDPYLDRLLTVSGGLPVTDKPEEVNYQGGYEFSLNHDIFPANKSYYTYHGSLTTPGCSEIVLWHVFENPRTLSYKQEEDWIAAHMELNEVAHNNRYPQPLNNRTLAYAAM